MIIKKLRKINNWSQEQLAVFSGLNVRTIQRVESGHSTSIETLKSLAAVFEVNVELLSQEVSTIDKNSDKWQKSPWWFRLAFYGVKSKKAQIWIEFSLYLLSIFALFIFKNKFAVAGLFTAVYFTGLAIRFGEKRMIW